LLIADGASWHDSKTLEIPQNITIAKLPPYSPELNPTERLFQHFKDKIIKNKLWTTISEFKDNVTTQQPITC
jgi:putative transposase